MNDAYLRRKPRAYRFVINYTARIATVVVYRTEQIFPRAYIDITPASLMRLARYAAANISGGKGGK
jgi:hypothetical protein